MTAEKRINFQAICLAFIGLAGFVFLTLYLFTHTYHKAEAELSVGPGTPLLENETATFSKDEKPNFVLDTANQVVVENLNDQFDGEVTAKDQKKIRTKLLRVGDEVNAKAKIAPDKYTPGKYSIEIPKPADFHPGEFEFDVTIQNGSEEKTLTQNFAWGVLAINTNKSAYSPSESAYLQMSSLNEFGHTRCDSNLLLTITDPNKGTTTLSTNNDGIKRSESCNDDNVTDLPDYTADYQTNQAGSYQMTLINIDKKYQIHDSFEVKSDLAVNIERVGATRINPFKSSYVMNLKVVASEPINGKLREKVPADFVLSDISGGGQIVDQTDGTRNIEWPLSMSAGESLEFSYRYQAPQISPELYLLGPAEIITPTLADSGGQVVDTAIFTESRRWQIASDAAYTATASTDWNTNSTWGGSGHPVAGDTANIPAFTPTVGSAAACLTVNFTSTGGGIASNTGGLSISGTLTQNANASAVAWSNTLSGAATISVANIVIGSTVSPLTNNSNVTHSLIVTATTLNISGGVTLNSYFATTNRRRNPVLDIRSGTTTISGATDITTVNANANNTASVLMNGGAGTGTLNLAGATPWSLSGTGTNTTTLTASSTVNYTKTTGGQNPVLGTTYATLGMTNTSGTQTANGAITATTLNTTASGILDMVTYALTVTNVTNNGIIHTQCTTNPPFTASKVWTPGTVQFDSTAGGQSVPAGTYNLTLANTGRIATLVGNVTVTSALTISSGTLQLSTLNFTNNGTSSITGTLDDSSNTGTNLFVGLITVQTGGSFTSTGNSAYEIRGGITNYETFTGGTGTYTFSTNSQDISGDHAITFGGAVSISGAINISNKNTSTITITGALDGNNASSTWINTANSYLYLTSTTKPFNTSGVLTASANPNTVNYNASGGGQSIKDTTYDTLTLSNTSNTDTAAGAVAVNTGLTTTASGILDMSTYQLSGAFTPTNNGTIKTQNTLAAPIPTGKTWAGTVEYDSAASGQTVSAGTYNDLIIDKTAQTATLGGTTTVNNDLTVTSGILGGTANITVKGEVTGAGTVTLTGSSTFTQQIGVAKSFGSSGGSAAWTFSNLSFENSSAGDLDVTTRAGGSGQIVINGTLTVGNAANSNTTTLTNVTNDRALVAGSVSITSKGALVASDATDLIVNASWANSGTFTASGGTVVFADIAGSKTLSGTLDGASAFGGLTFDGSGGGWSINNSLKATGDFNLTNGTLTQGANIDLNFYGNITLANAATFTKASGTGKFIMEGDGGTETFEDQHIGAKSDLGAVQIGLSPGSTTLKSDMSGVSLTVPTSDTFNTKGWDVTMSSFMDFQGSCNLNATDTAPNNEGDGTIFSVAGNFTMSGTANFTQATSTVTFTGNAFADQIFTDGGKTYNNITLNNNQGTYDGIVVTGNLDVNGTLTITDGDFDLITAASDPNVNTAGSVSIASNGTVSKGTGAWTFDGGSTTFADSSSGGPQNIGNITIGPSTTTTLTTNSNMKVTDVTIGADDTLDISSDTLYVDGNFVNGNTLTTTSSTVDFTKSSSSQTLTSGGVGAGKIFNNLTHSGAGTLQLVTNPINVDGIFTNSAGTFDANDLDMNVADDFLGAGGTFSPDVSPGATTQTVTFDSTTEATVSGSNTFRNLTMNTTTDGAKTIKFTAGTTQTIGNTWTLDGDVGKVLTIKSTSDTNAWYFVIPADINPTGDYIDVRDSQNTTNAYRITAISNYTNSGNNDPGWIFGAANAAPNAPTSLAQKKVTGGATLATGDWTGETQVQFTATISDDDSDQVRLCVEKDQLGTGFSNTEDLCGDLVASGGTATVTISGQTDAAEYHWQARSKDEHDEYSASWVAYGGNAEGARDYGIDTTAPTGGTIYDGTDGTDDAYNSGSLSALSAYWTSAEPNFAASGKAASNVYQYAIGTTAGGNDIRDYTATGNTGADSYIDASGLTLRTGQTYYFSIKATDAAGNIETLNSNGIAVAPTLTFSYLSGSSVTFDELNSGNSWTDSAKTTVLRTSTNAYSGYVIKAFASGKLQKSLTEYFDHFAHANSAPATWSGTGFGYTTSDSTLSGGTADRFTNGGPKYAGFTESGPGDPVGDNLNSGHVQITNDDITITYRVTGNSVTPAGTYSTTIIYTCIPQY